MTGKILGPFQFFRKKSKQIVFSVADHESSIVQFPKSRNPHSTAILKEYFKNIPLKSCNIAKILIKLLERFLKYCRNLAMSVQNIINGILL